MTQTYTTKEDVKAEVSKSMEQINLLLSGVVIVLLVGFATLFVAIAAPIIDAWRFRAASYEALTDKINSQDEKIDLMTQQLSELQGAFEKTQAIKK